MSVEAGVLTPDVSVSDRAFRYGDGLFETVLCLRNRPLWGSLHIDRMMLGAQRLRIALHRPQLEAALAAAAGALVQPGVVRMAVSRADRGRGYAPALDVPGALYISAAALGHSVLDALPAARLAVGSVVLGDQPLLAGMKHCNRLEQVLAAAEAAELAVDDVLVHNARGAVQCTGTANIFALQGEQLVTPPCQTCGITGTRRRLIIEQLGPGLGFGVAEREITLEELLASDGVFMSNALIGIRVVGAIGGQVFAPHAHIDALQAGYFALVRSACAG